MAGIELGVGFVSLVPSAKNFGKELDGQLQNEVGPVGDKHGQGLGGAVIGGITKVAALGGVGAALFGGVALKSGLERLTTIQDATASLTTIMGDAGKAGNLMNQIKETVNGTPFNLDQFATAGKNLVAMNVPAQKVPGYLRAIGEAAAASGKGAEGVSQITDTFGKMAAQGKVSLDQIWSISDAGVPALQILANGFGVTTDEMQKMISNGAVPSAKAMDILTKGIMDGSKGAAGATVAYAGTMEKLRGTFNGALGGMKASIARLGASVLEPLMPFLTAGMAKFTAWADTMGKKVGPEITKLIEGVKALIGSFQSGDASQTGFIGKMQRIGVVLGSVAEGAKVFFYALKGQEYAADGAAWANPLINVGARIHVMFGEVVVAAKGFFAELRGQDYSADGAPWANSLFRVGAKLHEMFLGLGGSSKSMFGALRSGDTTAATKSLSGFKDALVPIGGAMTAAKDKSGGFMDTLKSLGGAFAATGSGGVTVLQNLLSGLAGTMAFLGHHTTLLTGIIVAIGVATAAQGPVNEAYKTAMIYRTALLPITTTATFVSASATRALAAATRESTAATTQGAAAQNTGILATIRGTAAKVAHTIAESAKTAVTWLGVTAITAYEFATSGTVLATIRSTAASVAHGIAMGVVRVATLAWTGVQWLLNAALNANPIGLVVIAVAALAAGVILAYKHSETFRQIVQAAWQGIQAAASFAWNSILKPTFDAFMVALHWVGDAAMWLWHNAIEPGFAGIKFAIEVAWWAIRVIFDLWKFAIMDVLVPAVMWFWHNTVEPAFAAIGQIISFAWNSVIKPVFDFLRSMIMDVLVPTVMSFWRNTVEPAFNGIGAVISFVWNTVIRTTFDFIKAALAVVGDTFSFIWNSVIKPVWSALGDGIRWVYDNVIRPNWDALKAALALVGDAFGFVWNNVIRPVWTGLGDGISAVYHDVIQPVWDRLKGALSAVGDFFREVVGGISSKWDELRDAVSKPIMVVIGFLGDKLGGAWNAVKKILPVLPDFPKLAEGGRPGDGGRLSGPGTGTSDSILGMNYFTGMPTAHVSNGEFVVKEKSYRQYPAEVEAINAGTFPKLALGGLPSGTVIGSGTAGVDGGTTWPALFAKVKGQFPWAIDTSDVRPGDTGYHGKGQAVDIGAPGNNQGMLDQVGAWAVQNMGGINEIIHNPNASVKNGQNVPASFWGAQTWAEHANHVHLASSALGLSGSAVGDAGMLGNAALAVTHFLRDKAAGIFDLAMKPVSAVVDKMLPSDGPGFNKMPKGVFDTVRDAARSFIVGKADSADAASSSSGATSLGPLGGNADAYAREIFRSAMEHGFGKEGAAIGVATSIVETGLKMYANSNVPASLAFPHDAVGSDHDSDGLFQQREQGWGTLAERMTRTRARTCSSTSSAGSTGAAWNLARPPSGCRCRHSRPATRRRWAERTRWSRVMTSVASPPAWACCRSTRWSRKGCCPRSTRWHSTRWWPLISSRPRRWRRPLPPPTWACRPSMSMSPTWMSWSAGRSRGNAWPLYGRACDEPHPSDVAGP